jgi:hypothetical protein
MLDRGLTENGAAQALGWPKTRVTARVKILELPERAQQLIGEGAISLACVDQLRAIGTVAPQLLGAGDRLSRRRQRVGRRAPHARARLGARRRRLPTVAAARCSPPTCTPRARTRSPSCGWAKKTEQLYAQAEKLHKQLDRYAYGPPQVPLQPTPDVDRARPPACSSSSSADGRSSSTARCTASSSRPRSSAPTTSSTPRRPAAAQEKRHPREQAWPGGSGTVAKRERGRAAARSSADQAHGANLDLGHALIHKLTSVDPTTSNVARFFVFAVLGADHDTRRTRRPGADRPDRRRRGALVIDELAHRRHPDRARTAPAAPAHRLRATTGNPEAALVVVVEVQSTAQRGRASSMAAR